MIEWLFVKDKTGRCSECGTMSQHNWCCFKFATVIKTVCAPCAERIAA